MAGTLVVAEHLRGEIRPVTLELVSAAKELGGPVTVLVVDDDPASLTDAVNLDGVDAILTCAVDADEFENDVCQAAVEAAIGETEPDAVLLGFTVNSMGFAPALAAKLGTGFASDVFAVATRGRRGRRPTLLLRRQGQRRARVPGSGARASCSSAPPPGRPPRAQAARRSRSSRRRLSSPAQGTRSSSRLPRATSTSRRRTSCSRSAAASARRRRSRSSRSWPAGWARPSPSRVRSSTRAG